MFDSSCTEEKKPVSLSCHPADKTIVITIKHKLKKTWQDL